MTPGAVVGAGRTVGEGREPGDARGAGRDAAVLGDLDDDPARLGVDGQARDPGLLDEVGGPDDVGMRGGVYDGPPGRRLRGDGVAGDDTGHGDDVRERRRAAKESGGSAVPGGRGGQVVPLGPGGERDCGAPSRAVPRRGRDLTTWRFSVGGTPLA